MIRTVFAILLCAMPAQAAGYDPASMSAFWSVPFIGLLLSLACLPLLLGEVWHAHYGKIIIGWGMLFVVPFALVFGIGTAVHELLHMMIQEYIPFLILLLALYTVGGGILVRGSLIGTPLSNTMMLLIGTALASLMGTTGAAMVMIRPMIRANAFRKRTTHTFVFFIFLVANLGGSLTPLGDPPLYLGFLKGVPFFWPTQHLFLPFLFCAVVLLCVYYVIDTLVWRREAPVMPNHTGEKIRLSGQINIILLLLVAAVVLMQGVWHPGNMEIFGQQVGIERFVAVVLLLAIVIISANKTSDEIHVGNGFAWGAMIEVAKVFAGIFITMAPVLAILRAGEDGALGGLVQIVSRPDGTAIPTAYFWMSGGLSSFLDNAPTYLVFFNMAGGDPAVLSGVDSVVLMAISCGAVFMGANSYIGNAPNFMVKAIAEGRGVKMPSFFGYCGWACVFLVPLFVVTTLIFF